MALIYKIFNTINDKVYIGKTEFSLEKRFQEHCKDSVRYQDKEIRPLYRAMNKYGRDKFFIELIEETNNAEEREKYWIEYYDSFHKGYNATIGGDGKKLYDYELIKNLIMERKTYSEIQNIVGCSQDTISNIAKAANLSVIKATCKPVIGVEKSSLKEYRFDSAAEAARWLVEHNYTYSIPKDIKNKISLVCRGNRKSAYGFIWHYL